MGQMTIASPRFYWVNKGSKQTFAATCIVAWNADKVAFRHNLHEGLLSQHATLLLEIGSNDKSLRFLAKLAVA